MINRKIYLYRKTRIEPVNIVQDSQVEISLEFMDYSIPSGATVKAYAKRAFGGGDTYVCDCTASGSAVTFTPPEGFFLPGGNYLQIEVNGAIIPFTVDVQCERRLNDGEGSGEPEKVKALLAQAQAAAASAKESEKNASANATAGQSEAAAKSSASSASSSASAAGSSAKAAQTAQETTEGIAGSLAETVEAAEEATQRAKSAAEACKDLAAGINAMVDDSTFTHYRLGINNGIIYLEEV